MTIIQPYNIDGSELRKEIEQGIDYILNKGLQKNFISIAEAFLQLVLAGEIDAPAVSWVLDSVRNKAEDLDCIFLPGGENVPTAWHDPLLLYGRYSYYRSLVEICLIREARKRGIPLMGVCRGLQVTYVYHGAKLNTMFRTNILPKDCSSKMPMHMVCLPIFSDKASRE